ncbi:MAG: hypothetical protein WBI08_07750 [Bacteroidales bacterium]
MAKDDLSPNSYLLTTIYSLLSTFSYILTTISYILTPIYYLLYPHYSLIINHYSLITTVSFLLSLSLRRSNHIICRPNYQFLFPIRWYLLRDFLFLLQGFYLQVIRFVKQ